MMPLPHSQWHQAAGPPLCFPSGCPPQGFGPPPVFSNEYSPHLAGHAEAASFGWRGRPEASTCSSSQWPAVRPPPQQYGGSSGSGSPGSKRDRDDGHEIAERLAGHSAGERVEFGRALAVRGEFFTGAHIERNMGSASGAQLITMLPQGKKYILKFEDVHKELAALCTLRRMNARWHETGHCVCGVPVDAVTYNILPLGSVAGLVEVVGKSATLRELGAKLSYDEKHLRVGMYLRGNPHKLDRLAATTAAYLAAGYALGVRDGHDDNIMLREDGSLFRVDFGFLFGRTPEFDAPATFVPRAVSFALGQHRWAEVVGACTSLLASLTGAGRGDGVGWAFLRSVRELGPYQAEARLYASRLDLESFNQEVRHADEWSFSRTVKNTLRDVKRYVMTESETVPSSPDLLGLFDGASYNPKGPPPEQRFMLPVSTTEAPSSSRVARRAPVAHYHQPPVQVAPMPRPSMPALGWNGYPRY